MYVANSCGNFHLFMIIVSFLPISCADVLAEEGEVHVALCRGQGGTPADKPQREWHNSWQVVAMAALGGLILSDVYPFSCKAVPGYKCTGYR